MPAGPSVAQRDMPSRIGKHVIDRARLRDQAFSLTDVRLTHVHAPAGFGKTTLMRQWYEALEKAGHVVAWLNADRHDLDIVRRITAVLSDQMSELSALLSRADSEGGFRTTDVEVQALIRAAAASDRPIVIFVDEAEMLRQEAGAALLRMIGWLPENMSFVCGSRGKLPFPVARLQALGELAECRAHDLRFTVAETREAARAAGIDDLQATELQGLHERTEGWATGLKLALLAMRGESNKARLIASFSGHKTLVADFFSETVFGQQTAEVQNFLMRTGVFDRFSAEMCDAVLGITGSQDLLSQIESAGLFLIPLDDERHYYRYHGLFSSFLGRRLNDLDPGTAEALHLAASKWFAKTGANNLAVEHALKSGNTAWLAELLDEVGEDMTYTGSMTYIEGLVKNLPPSLVVQWPRLLMIVAWAQSRRVQIESAERTLGLARERIDQMEADGASAEEIVKLRTTFSHREMTLAAAQDKFAIVEQMSNRIQRENPECHPYLACTLYGQTIRALREQFKIGEVEKLEAKARGGLEKSGYKFAYVALQAIVGPTLHAIGRTAAGKVALEHGLSQALSYHGEKTGLGALPALPLAELAYECNDLETARALIDGYLDKARVYGFADELSSGYTVAARLHALDSAFDAAFRVLDEAHSIALECGIERLRLRVIAERVRLLIRIGHIERAQHLAQITLPTDIEALAPNSLSTSLDETMATIAVRASMTQGEHKNALQTALRWRQFAAHRGMVRSQLHWNVLSTRCQFLLGERRAAQRHLREAVIVGAENRLLRPFVDEGLVIQELLREAYGDGQNSGHPAEQFARDILRAFGANFEDLPATGDLPFDEMGLDGKITGREIEILSFVAAGLRNREIGLRLGLTEGSVKWYMQQIYDKIGTRRRTVAVERARQFGLLN